MTTELTAEETLQLIKQAEYGEDLLALRACMYRYIRCALTEKRFEAAQLWKEMELRIEKLGGLLEHNNDLRLWDLWRNHLKELFHPGDFYGTLKKALHILQEWDATAPVPVN